MRKVLAWGLRRPRALTMMFSLFWRRHPQNEKRAILCEKGSYCELAGSLSSLDTASEREPAIRRVHGASGNAAYAGGGGAGT